MKRKEFIFIFLLFFFITAIFFYKTFLHGYVPMAGDLLISEYNPWKTYSYAGYNPGSYPNKAQYFDVIRQMYPWKTFSTNTLKSGHMPLWNPYNFSGAPLLANFQSAVLYPFTILYFFLPNIIAWTILIFLQPFLAGIFTYSFTRKIGLSKIASIFSGICFAFSSFFSVWLEYNTVGHVIVWLPLMLLSVEHLLEKRAYGNTSIRWVIVFIFSLVSSLFAGHIQVFGYICIFLIAYIIFKVTTVSENKKKLFLSFGLLFFITLGIGAIQIIPGLELISFSARSAHSYSDIINKILIQPWQVIMFIVPDFFGNPATRNYWLSDTYVGKVTSIGIVPLFFIFLTFAKWRNLLTRFFLGSIIIILLFVTVNPLTMFLYKVNLPFFSSSSPAMGVILLCFCLSILTGFGIDTYRKEKISLKRFIITSHILIVLFLFLWGIVLFVPRMVHADWVEHF